MRSAFAVAAFAGIALAAPHYGYGTHQQGEVENVHWVIETIVETVTVVDGAEPTDAPQYPTDDTPAYTTVVVDQPAPAYTPAPYQPAQPATPTSAPYQASTPAPASGYMGIVNEYRGKMGKPAFTQSSQLEANSLKCVTESNGQMIHELNPGSYGQVLAPGQPGDFEHVFVGGWICEEPSLLGADGSTICATQSQGWEYSGTGHADILSSESYTQIGCSNYNGIWGCDVA